MHASNRLFLASSRSPLDDMSKAFQAFLAQMGEAQAQMTAARGGGESQAEVSILRSLMSMPGHMLFQASIYG